MSRIDDLRDKPTWNLTGDDALELGRHARIRLNRLLRTPNSGEYNEPWDASSLLTLAVASSALLDALDNIEAHHQPRKVTAPSPAGGARRG